MTPLTLRWTVKKTLSMEVLNHARRRVCRRRKRIEMNLLTSIRQTWCRDLRARRWRQSRATTKQETGSDISTNRFLRRKKSQEWAIGSRWCFMTTTINMTTMMKLILMIWRRLWSRQRWKIAPYTQRRIETSIPTRNSTSPSTWEWGRNTWPKPVHQGPEAKRVW